MTQELSVTDSHPFELKCSQVAEVCPYLVCNLLGRPNFGCTKLTLCRIDPHIDRPELVQKTQQSLVVGPSICCMDHNIILVYIHTFLAVNN